MRFFATLLCVLVVVPLGVSAQIIPTIEPSVEVRVIPEFPAPGANILITAHNLLNKDALSYIWSVNGQVVDQGIGRDSITTTVGSIGEQTVISLTVQDGSRVVGEVTRSIVPAELDLVWEADSYTPPFYSGRPLPTGDTVITVTAVPDVRVSGVRTPKDTLIYEWFLDDSVRPFQTGYGLDTVRLTPPVFDSPFTVTVQTKTQSGSIAAQNTTEIVPQRPEVLLYEETALLGTLFHRAVSGVLTLFDEEVTIQLFPLFVANPNQSTYSWEVNGGAIDSGETPREITLRKTGSDAGRVIVEADFRTPNSLFEQASERFILTF